MIFTSENRTLCSFSSNFIVDIMRNQRLSLSSRCSLSSRGTNITRQGKMLGWQYPESCGSPAGTGGGGGGGREVRVEMSGRDMKEAEAMPWLKLKSFNVGREEGPMEPCVQTGGRRGCGVFRDHGGPRMSIRQ